MTILSVHVTKFTAVLEKSKKTTVYVTEVDTGKQSWEVEVRYSKFHEFRQELLKWDRNVVIDLPFPTKDLFSNQSPDHRQKELDKFVTQLHAAYEALSTASQVAFLELLQVEQHPSPRAAAVEETPEELPAIEEKEMPQEKRSSKQSISSTTTTELDEDNQRDSITDSHLDDHHDEPLSPVRDEPADEFSPEEVVAPVVEEPKPIDVAEPVVEATKKSEPPVDAIITETSKPSTHEKERVEATVSTTAETTCVAADVVEVAPAVATPVWISKVESYQAPSGVHHHVWTKASVQATGHFQCRVIVCKTFRALYPSLFV
ncbi:Aste57867_20999 [Aphanomyces stellatus]|uniref:Aste57867_20999 protein n=1 Tax=Aphanomyces stellatus TaxID=120398 RepID=A0A485LH48_9STRA|nr:hypothetical protein As57867_020931 [Aphanomyces stellatus]VFT97674.1 Aste57867_20999 [Aphanomyces stellatus]